jgi:hypothetical protein
MRVFEAILYGLGITTVVWLVSTGDYLVDFVWLCAVGICALIYLEITK